MPVRDICLMLVRVFFLFFFFSFFDFPCGSAGKESACSVGDLGLIPGLGRSPGEGTGYPLQYSGLENSMDCIVHGVGRKESDTTERLFTSLHFPSLLSELSLPMFPQDPAQVTLGGFILLAALRADCAVFTALP